MAVGKITAKIKSGTAIAHHTGNLIFCAGGTKPRASEGRRFHHITQPLTQIKITARQTEQDICQYAPPAQCTHMQSNACRHEFTKPVVIVEMNISQNFTAVLIDVYRAVSGRTNHIVTH